MARKEKELHLQLYPGWSARDNYATHNKKKKRKKDMGGSDKGMRPEDRYLDNPAFGKYRNMKVHADVVVNLVSGVGNLGDKNFQYCTVTYNFLSSCKHMHLLCTKQHKGVKCNMTYKL